MKLIFMGTPDFAVYGLVALQQSSHEILAVVSVPDKAQGRGKKLKASPVKKKALELGYKVFEPESLSDENFLKEIEELEAELIVVIAFKKLPQALFSMPPFGTINIHASLLPKYRGAAPINHALLNGEKVTGVTSFYINEEIDAGTILLQEECPILESDNFATLYEKLALLGADLIVKTLDQLDHGGIEFKVQNSKNASKAGKITSESCKIDWNNSAERIHNQIRAFSPKPSAYSYLNKLKFKLLEADFKQSDSRKEELRNGSIVELSKKSFGIQCKDGIIYPKQIQLEGKKVLPIHAFLNGVNLEEGTVLGE